MPGQAPRRLRSVRALLLLAVLPLPLVPGTARAADLTPQRQIESRLMCYCGCSDLTVRTCTCGAAEGIRQEIAERLARGEHADQVVAAFVQRYGEKIRSAPTKRGFDLLAWVAPFAVLLAAGAGLVLVIKKWGDAASRGRTSAGAPAARTEPAPYSAAEREVLKRIERDIREGL